MLLFTDSSITAAYAEDMIQKLDVFTEVNMDAMHINMCV